MSETQSATTVGHAILARLRDAGIEYFLANAGTDFPPIIEAFAQSSGENASGPEPLVVPHENVAIAMAHGYAMVTGKPLAVMLHVNVGTSNAICGLTNASRMNIPLVLMAGRTPLTEHGSVGEGTRSRHIHWAQEMFDQAGMLRELVKWDYELRAPAEVDVVVDRAISLTQSPIRGPVYLTIPREVLSAPATPGSGPLRAAPSGAVHADPAQLVRAGELLAAAENPLIITSDTGRSTAAAADLAALAERFAIPVIAHVPRYLNLPDNHPMHLGYEPSPHLAQADVVLALDSDVPWIPATDPVREDAAVIQLAEDPLFSRYPVRGFPASLSIAADSATALNPLAQAVAAAGPEGVENRRARVTAQHEEIAGGWRAAAERAALASPIQAPHLSACVGEVVAAHDAILVNEMGIPPQFAGLTSPGSYFGPSPAGGLGWGLGAALGAKLAAPERLVVATIGDGSYFFGNPLAAHYASRAYDLPVLFIITENGGWGAVRRATRAMYPDGSAVAGNAIPLSRLDPAPDYEQVITSCGGYGERVSDPAELPAALERALEAVVVERRQALLNVICAEG
jgi:acetolactate synthase-1/2/3 large subunit